MSLRSNGFLKKYDRSNKELFLKARFIFMVTIGVILATALTIGHSIYLQGMTPPLFIQVMAVLVMSGALVVLVQGQYNWAIHIIFAAGFSSLWLVMFFDPPFPVLAKLDSIVLVIGLFSAMNVAFFRTRFPILIYLAINAAAFLLYLIHLEMDSVLPRGEMIEYFFDNAVALAFVSFVAYNAVAINRQILSTLELELSERKKAQQALLESQRKLSDHLNNTPVGSIFWDLKFRVVEWNPSAQSIFGYSKQEALGKSVNDLILPENMKASVSKIFDDLLSQTGGERSVNENITKNGKRIICDWYNSVLRDADGNITGVASLVNDITEKIKIQEIMIQSEKMMSVGGLAAGMAHEVNNPLSGMIQNAQLANQRLTASIPANCNAAQALGLSLPGISAYAKERGILKQLDHINEAGQHALQVIQNMLNFSRKSDSVREPVDITDLIDRTVVLAGHDHGLNLRYAFKHIDVIREYEESLPPIFCEKTKIQQVLLNLFKNASDSMNEKDYGDGSPQIILRAGNTQNHVHIEVEDNGTGIQPETCRQIFTPFFSTKKLNFRV